MQHQALAALDAEIAAARAGMIAHIDEHIVPLMVRRALARMAAGDAPSAPPIPPARRKWPKAPATHPTLKGCALAILNMVASAPPNSVTGSVILQTFVDQGVKYDTVAKAKTRLANLGLVVKYGPYWNVAENPIPASPVSTALTAAGQTSVAGMIIDILRAGPPEGMTAMDLDDAMVAGGIPLPMARRNRYAIEQRGRIVHDREARLWRMP